VPGELTKHRDHQHYKGAKDHAAYRSTFKQVVTAVAQEAATLQLSIMESGRRMQQILNHDYNMSFSLSWCRKSMKHALDAGKIVSPQKPCGVYIPSNLEVRIVSLIKRVRQQKLPMFLDDVMSWATHMITDTEHEHNFVNGQASEGWYRGFLRHHGLMTGTKRPLEMTRA
jgi:hypothetical protein